MKGFKQHEVSNGIMFKPDLRKFGQFVQKLDGHRKHISILMERQVRIKNTKMITAY